MIVAGLSLAAAALTLRLWRGDLGTPWEYASNDSEYQLMLVRGVLRNGWWFTNPQLGAPFGQELYDFAVGGDNLHLLLIRMIGVFSSNAALVENLFYLLSFPLAGAAAYAVIRGAGCSRPASGTAAILFAITPYALLRSEHHVFLAADFAIPLGAGLALAALEGRPLFTRRAGASRYPTARTLLTIGACVAVGSTGTFYYGIFSIALLAIAGLAAAWRQGRAAVITPLACISLIALTFAVDLAPTLLYQLEHGVDHSVARRLASESDLYGLKLTQLVLPVPGERIGALARLTERYRTTTSPPFPNESYSSALGLVGVAGFALLIIALLAAGAHAADPPEPEGKPPRLVAALAAPGLLTLVALLIGMIGGLGTLFAYVLTPQLRGWSRIAPFIAFLSLLAIARLLDLAGRRTPLLAGAALLIGMFDQTAAGVIPDYRASAMRWHADQRFAAALAAAMPAGAEIFQLPYERFPEGSPLRGTGGYDELRPYLAEPTSSTVRFSFGASRGRPADWGAQLALEPARLQLPAVAAAGFDGLLVDTAALPVPPSVTVTTLHRLLGTLPVTEGGHFAFFDLRPYAARVRSAAGAPLIAAARRATLHPLTVGDPLLGEAKPTMLSSGGARLTLHNPSSLAREAQLSVYTGNPPASTLILRAHGVSKRLALVPVDASVTRAAIDLRLGPGATQVVLTPAPGAAQTTTTTVSVTITDLAQIDLAAAVDQVAARA